MPWTAESLLEGEQLPIIYFTTVCPYVCLSLKPTQYKGLTWEGVTEMNNYLVSLVVNMLYCFIYDLNL